LGDKERKHWVIISVHDISIPLYIVCANLFLWFGQSNCAKQKNH
jgi:hypothetical protein